jgi:hypothetical protein
MQEKQTSHEVFFWTIKMRIVHFLLAQYANNDYLLVIGMGHMCRSGPGILFSIQIQRVAGMCKPD